MTSPISFLYWYFLKGPVLLFSLWKNLLAFLIRLFNFVELSSTILSPWKRYECTSVDVAGMGDPIQHFIHYWGGRPITFLVYVVLPRRIIFVIFLKEMMGLLTRLWALDT